jgi:hypothetical protein
MPSPKCKCEFCDKEFRTDALGVHVKSKHEDEIIKMIILTAMDDCEETTYQNIISFDKTKPIKSINFENGFYFFGKKPQLCMDMISSLSYCQNVQNMKLHKNYINNLIMNISIVNLVKTVNFCKNLEKENEKMKLQKKMFEIEMELFKKTAEIYENASEELKKLKSC